MLEFSPHSLMDLQPVSGWFLWCALFHSLIWISVCETGPGSSELEVKGHSSKARQGKAGLVPVSSHCSQRQSHDSRLTRAHSLCGRADLGSAHKSTQSFCL
uniref:Uncharacterized protein n=2 Tax=Nothobranchius TaxID=28779 RepID=A0A1A8UP20_NOTFU